MFFDVLTAAHGELHENNVENESVLEENVEEESEIHNKDEVNSGENVAENKNENIGDIYENNTENEVEVIEDELVDDEQDVAETKTIQNHSIQSVAFDEHEDFNVTISEVVDGDGNPYTEDNPLGINDEFIVELNSHLQDNHNYTPGDIETR